MEVHKNKKNMLSCLRCNAIFERQITLDEHILRTHPNFIAFVISKIHECTLCAFKTTRSGCFKEHLLEHPEANPNYKFRTCAHCNVAFKKKVSLDNHMLNKHPNFISSVTYKIHKCTECNYRTTMSTHLKRHLLKHTETPTNHILRTCAICPAEFKSKRSLDDHILRNHPNSIASVTYKIHECTLCTFKTTRSGWFQEHLLKHPGTISNYKFFTCTHCNMTFKTKTSLDNHVIKKHPNSTSSVTNKIHRCTECNYKTTKSTDLKKHSLKHTEILDTRLLSTCAFCPAGFKSKRSLDQHIVKKHPNCIASVTKKILKCTKCTYKTTISSQLKSHLLKHSKAQKNYKYNTCTHCDVTFKRKTFLDNHLIKKHLNFISSVTNKIHKCTKCSYKTTISSHFKSHLSRHSETPTIHMLSTCPHCNRTFERQITLNEHILRTHPNFIAFITSKIHECTLCAFKTTRSDCFKDHLLKHPEANTNYKFRTCAHCNVAFKKKVSLDNHMLNKHPNFISSVTHKIHKCTECNYRTTMSNHLKRHLLKHTETPTNHKLWTCNYKFFTCRHCNTTFKTKTLLDNHVIKKHPNSTSSVTNKIHRCTECNYKTTKSTDLKKHSLKHTEIPDTRLLSTCAFCPAGFKSKRSLDQHIVKKHPNSIASVTEKILKCRKCTYKTTISSHLKSHLLNHSKAPA
nr:unnamed protein product [Callosobruchus chinensis]